MNSLAQQIVQLGIFLAVAIVLADLIFAPFYTLDWLAVAGLFIVVSGWITVLLTRPVITNRPKILAIEEASDELKTLEDLVDRALSRRDPNAIGVLSERLRLLILNTSTVSKNHSNTEAGRSSAREAGESISTDRTENHLSGDGLLRVDSKREMERLLERIEGA